MARPASGFLIRNADIHGFGRGDLRCANGKVAVLARRLDARPDERVIDAGGGALLPGLHDHHIHLAGLAVRDNSVVCGPPDVTDAAGLVRALSIQGSGWIRGIGYHESVLGTLPTARELDGFVTARPLRIQHRSGRMWLFNNAGLEELLARGPAPAGLEREDGRYTGRLFDEDDWLRAALGSAPPDFAAVSSHLAAMGVTGLTDMSVHNGARMAAHFASQKASGALVQNVVLAGTPDLANADDAGWRPGPVKLHLHEAELPDFDAAVNLIAAAHRQGRAIAIHCVSEVELVFALAALDEAGTEPADRIEHASVTPSAQLARMTEMRLAVCSQPHFIAERGDRYLIDVEARLHGDLYRLKSFLDVGLALAGGSDAPFGSDDPWQAMHAAVTRRTAAGRIIGADEALTPEEALALYLADPADLAVQRRIESGGPADLCLLDRPWSAVRTRIGSANVVLTAIGGRVVHDRIDQPPVERAPRR